MRAKSINFERGLDPKKSMGTGMTDERKMNYAVSILNSLGIEAEWNFEESTKNTYTIFKRDTANHIYVYCEYVDGNFITWETLNDSETSSPDEAVHRILRAKYPNINVSIKNTETQLLNLKKIKKFLKE